MPRRPKQTEISIQRRVHLFERLYADMKANEPYAKGGDISITFTVGRGPARIETNTDRQQLRSYLTLFRQLISVDDPVFPPRILRILPRHVDEPELRARLARAYEAWKAAQGFPSVFAEPLYGQWGSGRGTARLYMNGGVFHSDPELSDLWDSLGEDRQRFFEYQFRQYEGKVRNVFIELKCVIDAAREGGYLRDEALDLAGFEAPDST